VASYNPGLREVSSARASKLYWGGGQRSSCFLAGLYRKGARDRKISDHLGGKVTPPSGLHADRG